MSSSLPQPENQLRLAAGRALVREKGIPGALALVAAILRVVQEAAQGRGERSGILDHNSGPGLVQDDL